MDFAALRPDGGKPGWCEVGGQYVHRQFITMADMSQRSNTMTLLQVALADPIQVERFVERLPGQHEDTATEQTRPGTAPH